jgi:hypothetical protein
MNFEINSIIFKEIIRFVNFIIKLQFLFSGFNLKLEEIHLINYLY